MQAALALAPLNLIEAAHKDAQWKAWGNEIFVTAVFAIIICASVGVIAVNILAPRCLTKVLQISRVYLNHAQPQQGHQSMVELGRRSCAVRAMLDGGTSVAQCHVTGLLVSGALAEALVMHTLCLQPVHGQQHDVQVTEATTLAALSASAQEDILPKRYSTSPV